MNNQLMQVSEIKSLGDSFIKSGLFTGHDIHKAIVKIQAGQEVGISPFASMNGFHLISGKCAMGAGLIAAIIKGSKKYNYRVKENTDKICAIEFLENGEPCGISTFTIEEARRAGTKNLDKFPQNMLFARAISNGAKWFTPDIFNGSVYTPEELDTEDIAHTEVLPTVELGSDKYKEIYDKIVNGDGTIKLEHVALKYILTEGAKAEIEKGLKAKEAPVPVTQQMIADNLATGDPF